MEAKDSLEQQVKALQRQMGGLAKLFKDLKATVDNLEKKNQVSENREIQEIIDTQRVIDEIIVANSDCIKRMEKELKDISGKKAKSKAIHDVIEEVVSDHTTEIKKRKRCRYYNRGFCKYKNKCRFAHPTKICTIYEETGNCGDQECDKRHPKQCKWLQSIGGCQRGEQECEYLHNADAKFEVKKQFKCESCKYSWEDKNCVVEHIIKNKTMFFCLNCDDWVKTKENVLKEGWTLFNEGGFLRNDV